MAIDREAQRKMMTEAEVQEELAIKAIREGTVVPEQTPKDAKAKDNFAKFVQMAKEVSLEKYGYWTIEEGKRVFKQEPVGRFDEALAYFIAKDVQSGNSGSTA